ncbi:VOC family protein [Amycolatopsis sp. 195334CR]|uniref:VOC family protein n=1 Tax=Amycolatopsis sp. 195334CR TaxID=2814588 RepID=UPI001A8D53C5|nr:VOC family protein [Amycolatopsis sp. 195334CR]MBN6042134.1 VOC family protein [Amycolatopsis sp. 195334CR]
MSITLPALHHIGIVVADVEAAALDHERRWGVNAGPIVDLSFSRALLAGVPTDVSARYRFIDTGASQIELIEPTSRPSPYDELLPVGGVHHLAYFVDRIDAYLDHLRGLGEQVEVTFDASVADGTRFVYLKGLAHEPAIELIETRAAG